MKHIFYPALFAGVLLFGLGACSGGSSGGTAPPTGPPTSDAGTVSGLVSNQAGTHLANVGITIGSGAGAMSTQTNEQGFFSVSEVTPGSLLIEYALDGHVTNTKHIDVVTRQNTQVSITLQEAGTTQTIDASQAQTVTHRGGSVHLPANGIVNSAGQTVTTVVAQVTTMVPGDPNFEVSMPGDFTGVDGGNRVDLVSYGVVDVELKDTGGNDLQLAQGSTASIEFPLPPNDPGDATIPLWWFDETSGDWIREGDANRDAGDGVYRGTVTHFTPWNVDKGRPTAEKVVRLSVNGRPVVGASIRLQGVGWLAGGVTGLDGEVRIPVGANFPPTFPSVGDVMMLLPSGEWLVLRANETMPGPGGTLINEFTEADGVVETVATIVLAWGALPSDLDTHMTIPTPGLRYHMYYPLSARGALDASPWASLDTDDVTSFGPEIITISKSLPGVYRYTVHNFSGNGSHPISDSGATVTLILRDQPTRLYSVPTENPGSGEYWAVFELTYDADGNVSVTELNQFGNQDLLRL